MVRQKSLIPDRKGDAQKIAPFQPEEFFASLLKNSRRDV
jgi:hypothetical protein